MLACRVQQCLVVVLEVFGVLAAVKGTTEKRDRSRRLQEGECSGRGRAGHGRRLRLTEEQGHYRSGGMRRAVRSGVRRWAARSALSQWGCVCALRCFVLTVLLKAWSVYVCASFQWGISV